MCGQKVLTLLTPLNPRKMPGNAENNRKNRRFAAAGGATLRLDFAALWTHSPAAFAGPFGSRCRWCGAVAQLGERVVRNDEVSGSIPLSSTTASMA